MLEYVLLLSAFVTVFLLIHRWTLSFVRGWFEAMVAAIAGPGI